MNGVTTFLVLMAVATSCNAMTTEEAQTLHWQLHEPSLVETRTSSQIIQARYDGVHSPVFAQEDVPFEAVAEVAQSMLELPDIMVRFGHQEPQLINQGFRLWCVGVRLAIYFLHAKGRVLEASAERLPTWLARVRGHFLTLGVPHEVLEGEFRSFEKFARGKGRRAAIFRR